MAAIPALIALRLFSCSVEALPDSLYIEEFSFGSFAEATSLTITPQNWIYIVDRAEHSVLLYRNPAESPVRIGGYGWHHSSFDSPRGIAGDGINLFVADFGNHRIQRFDRRLSYISTLSTRDTSLAEARFGYPADLALSRFGDLYILDGENLRVLKFQVTGRFERSFGDIEQGSRRLGNPIALTVTANDHVLVLEPNRIIEFDYFGNFTRVAGEGVLGNAMALGTSADGYIVATDSALLFFARDGSIKRNVPFRLMMTEEPIGDVQDVLIHGDRLYLLTKTKCIVLSQR
jgi:hypothetical protein